MCIRDRVDIEPDAAAVQAERCQAYDLLLLDVMMPGEDGFSLCGRIRDEVDCPILFLTARTEDAALVQGFGLGADDYIKKPFSIAELRARVNAHLRREARSPVRTMNRGGIRFDMQAKEAFAGERTPVSYTHLDVYKRQPSTAQRHPGPDAPSPRRPQEAHPSLQPVP